MSASNEYVQQFDYLCTARKKLLDWVRSQPAEVYARPFPFGMGSIRATLVHTAAAQWSYTQRLSGKDPAAADNPFTKEKQPDFAPFAAAWDTLNPETRRALAGLTDTGRTLEWVRATPAPAVRMRTTAGGVASQLLFHEVHHRAQVMAMLRQVGVAAENLDYSVLMFERSPVT